MIIAKWIVCDLKYDVRMIPKINFPEGVQTPDFVFNNEKWDLKTISGSSNQVLYHSVYRKIKQSNNFIFDITNSNLDMLKATKQIEDLYRRPSTHFIDKTILIKNKDFIVFKRKRM